MLCVVCVVCVCCVCGLCAYMCVCASRDTIAASSLQCYTWCIATGDCIFGVVIMRPMIFLVWVILKTLQSACQQVAHRTHGADFVWYAG